MTGTPSSQPATQPSTRPASPAVPLRLLLALATLVTVAPISTDLYLPSFPAIGTGLAASASEVQLTLTAFLAGLALGQLVMGPLSDRYGRRGPLIASTTVLVAAGVVAALAPTLAVLVAARLVQGLAGAGGMVIGRAVIADLAHGREAARAFTLMMTVGGVAPVLAPLAGGLLFGPLGWRGLLWVVAGLCAVMLVVLLVGVPESRPPEVRAAYLARPRGDAAGQLLQRRFLGYAGVFACSFAMMMSYISSSPFVYQRVLGLSEVAYGVAFGVNACGLVATGFVVGRLARRLDPARIVRVALLVQLAATAGFVLLGLLGAPAWTFAVAIFVAVGTNGAIMGSVTALAMSGLRAVAGTASAVLGASQFALGALASPLVGLSGADSVLAPSVVMLIASALAGLSFLVARTGRARGAVPG